MLKLVSLLTGNVRPQSRQGFIIGIRHAHEDTLTRFDGSERSRRSPVDDRIGSRTPAVFVSTTATAPEAGHAGVPHPSLLLAL